MTEKEVDMYDFPVHDCTQEQNGSPYFSSIVRRYRWPSLYVKETVEIRSFTTMVT